MGKALQRTISLNSSPLPKASLPTFVYEIRLIKRETVEMENDVQKSIEIYKEQLSYGYIRTAYLVLTRYVAELKSRFSAQYKTGNISFGYLDYTYFPFFNQYLRNQKLRFGVVLNRNFLSLGITLLFHIHKGIIGCRQALDFLAFRYFLWHNTY